MKIELKSRTEIIDNQEITFWTLEKDEIVININEVIDADCSSCVIECSFIDTDKRYIEIQYNDWTSCEFIAIIDTRGNMLMKGISSIEKYIEEYELFIISITGHGLGDDALYYNVSSDDYKMAVINSSGKFIIPPNYDSIGFDEDELNFEVGYTDIKYNLKGERI